MTELTEDQPTIAQIRANRAAWAQALRSGEYEQGRGVLRRLAADRDSLSDGTRPTKDAYCCLGVGHNIISGVWDETGSLLSQDEQNPIVSVSGNLPLWSRKHIGLSEQDHAALVQMNDDFNFTFDQIAEVIESADWHVSAGPTAGSISWVAEYLFELHRKRRNAFNFKKLI